MLRSSSLKRKGELLTVSDSLVQRQRHTIETQISTFSADLVDFPVHEPIPESLFIFSPFGLCCRKCAKHVAIQFDERSIRNHLKKHGIDNRIATVRSLLNAFKTQLDNAKASGSIDQFRMNDTMHSGYSCACGPSFLRKANAVRHCKKWGCNETMLQKADLIKLCCGRYVSKSQVASLFKDEPSRIKQQFDYCKARAALLPFLPQREKNDHTYTHMFTPLIDRIGGGKLFVGKIRTDYVSIHSAPNPSREVLLMKIHKHAEDWLLNFASKNILMVPGNLRAALQTFEGGEVEDISHRCTYTMQHDPTSLLPELKKLLSFAYRCGLFASRGFDNLDAFALPYFLKDLLLEVPQSVTSLPFVVEFCLMFAFRVSKDGSTINMISCDTVSSVFSKISSVLKAAVCSVICSFEEQSFTTFGPALVKSVRESPVLHILSPMLRQIREMHRRLPKRRKTTLDSFGNITVDQFSFSFDAWSQVVPWTVSSMFQVISKLANGIWWEPVVDLATNVKVRVNELTGDIFLVDINPVWQQGPSLPLDQLDYFTAQLEMAFHGFGGGSARMTELVQPTMFHCVFSNETIYYSLSSLKGFNNASRRQFKEVQRKLPPIISRFFLLFRSLIQNNESIFSDGDSQFSMFPRRVNRSDFGPSHVIRDAFKLPSLPDMTQARQFWACVSNFVTSGNQQNKYLTSSTIGASKMGHSTYTHATTYSTERVGSEEAHFDAYHSAIGDTSYQFLKCESTLSLSDLRSAMQLRFPKTWSSDGHSYLSLQQKELVEFGYGPGSNKKKHCLGLLAPGDGKSESYIIPTIARTLANLECKTIIHVSPYSFLAGYQFANTSAVIEKLGFGSNISLLCFTGRDISQGCLPEEISDKKKLPGILFLNLDAIFNLFTFYFEHLKSWVDVVDKIVIDEVHTVFSELTFRDKYKVYWGLPVLGIPIVALSGSVPLFTLTKFAKRLCLSVSDNLGDMKVIHGGDIIGNFPKGFKIKVALRSTYLNKVATFVAKRLGPPPGIDTAIHVFVSEKLDGCQLYELLSSRYDCRFVSSDADRETINQVALEWSKGKFEVLISTSIALVGNENPRCRHLACAGYLYDSMQIVQALGRLRKYMRSSIGQVLFAVPERLPEFRVLEDQQRFTKLLNEKVLSPEDYGNYKETMTSAGVRDWLVNASLAQNDCALKILSTSFGKQRDVCGVCPFCRTLSTNRIQNEVALRLEKDRRNGEATERLLRKLALHCLVCKRDACRGIPLLKGKGSKSLPENRECCFDWKNCYKCGVSDHDRKTQCFDKTYLNNVACCECWVYKNVPGWERHERTECKVQGRLRRLLSYHFITTRERHTFQKYVEAIYTSTETFCQFMATVEK